LKSLSPFAYRSSNSGPVMVGMIGERAGEHKRAIIDGHVFSSGTT
jgi:hypothetical protein